MKKIAVLMSTYNGEKYLKDQVESILSQKGDFELSLFVRDDGSNDHTVSILDEYKNNGKLEWYSGENLGPARSFIDLLYKYCGYDYYAFSDQDDYWMDGKIEAGIMAIASDDYPSLYFCNTEYVDDKLNPLGGVSYKGHVPCDFYSSILNPGFIGCTMVFNSILAKAVQNHKVPQIVSMHDSFIARVCVSIGGKIIFDPDVHMLYRQHGNNVIGSTVGKLDAIKRRLRTITTKPQIGISMQLEEILNLYGDCIGNKEVKWIKNVMKYNNNIIERGKIAFSSNPKYISSYTKITIRLTILIGNL